MKNNLIAFFVGILMAVALGLAGMTQPSKVIGFLDFFGEFDPSLMFVMIGAIGVHFVAYRLIIKRPSPLFASDFQVPKVKIDVKLLTGAAIFGVGWGLSGFCPGPALTSLATGMKEVLIFVLAMAGGQWIFFLLRARSSE